MRFDVLSLNMRQVGVLLNLSRGQDTLASLARKVRCSSAAMTGIKDKLVVSGLITELNDAGDRRRVPVVLTDEGKEVVKRISDFVSDQSLGL